MPLSAAPLIEVVYISAARTPFSSSALRQLLSRARAKNARLGVTGLLLHADGSFLQVLEGPPEVIDGLYEAITADPRHHRIVRVFRTERTARTFGEWTMGFVEPDVVTRKTLEGFNVFLHGATSGTVDAPMVGKIRELAMQFRMGRWRQRIETGTPLVSRPA